VTIDQEKVVPYGLAGFVVALVVILVTIDVVASLPGSKGEASFESPLRTARGSS
jgi:hypothetical protein